MERKTKKVADLLNNPRWGRAGRINQAVIVGLAGSIEKIGLQIPPVTHGNVIIDGHCRVLAYRHLGRLEIEVIEFDHEPTSLELLTIPAHLDFHRSDLSALQRSKVLAEMQAQTGWTVTQLAEQLHIKQSMASKLLALQKLCSEARKLLEEGKIDIERAYMLSQSADPSLVQQATTLSRDQLRQKIKGKVNEPKSASARFCMPGGYVLNLSGGQMDLPTAVEVLTETVRLLRKGLAQGLTLASQVKVMRDTAKVGKA